MYVFVLLCFLGSMNLSSCPKMVYVQHTVCCTSMFFLSFPRNSWPIVIDGIADCFNHTSVSLLIPLYHLFKLMYYIVTTYMDCVIIHSLSHLFPALFSCSFSFFFCVCLTVRVSHSRNYWQYWRYIYPLLSPYIAELAKCCPFLKISSKLGINLHLL